MTTKINSKGIEITTGYGHKTQRGYVQLLEHQSDWMIQFDAQDAITLALEMLKAAEAANTDEFLIHWATEQVGLELEEAVPMLMLMREFREKKEEDRDGEDNDNND